MQFLKELLEMSNLSEGTEDIIPDGSEEYVQLPKPGINKKKKKKSFPTTDSAENSLINTLWKYQNADAS